MPAYNAADTISKAINSVLAQTYDNWELIVVDDGSMDETKNVVDSFKNSCHKIRYYFQKNAGPGCARNYGIEKANGEYVCFLDSDDYWDECFLALIDDLLKKEKADVVFYDMVRENSRGKNKKIVKSSSFQNCTKEELIQFQMTGLLEWGMTKIINRCLIIDNKLEFGKSDVAEEAIFSFDVLRLSNSCLFLEKPVYHYVNYENGQHAKGKNDPWFLTVKNMLTHLQSVGCLEKYKKTLNSFALRSFLICSYRLFTKDPYHISKSNVADAEKRYLKNFDIYNFEKNFLDRKTKILSFFLRKHFFFLVFCASRIRRASK